MLSSVFSISSLSSESEHFEKNGNIIFYVFLEIPQLPSVKEEIGISEGND